MRLRVAPWSPASAVRRWAADRRGVAGVEFALVAVPFVAMLTCVFEAGLDIYARQSLDYVVYQASRQLMLGNAQAQNYTAAGYQNALCAMLPPSMSCANLKVSVQSVTGRFSGYAANVPPVFEAIPTPYAPGPRGGLEVIQTYYAMPYITRLWDPTTPVSTFGGSPVRVLVAGTVVKNEP